MVALLELKEKFKKIFNKYDIYMIPGMKFIVALVALLMLNASIGYMSRLKNPLIAVAVAILCAFLPNGATIIFLSIFMIAHLYAISAELAIVTLCLFILMYLLYFRFTPKSGNILIITAILCWLKMPYLVPVAIGLTGGLLSIIPVSFGIMAFYIVKTASEFETAISNQTVSNGVQKFSFIIDSLINNKEMLICIAAVAVTIRLSVENAWLIAILAGAVVQFVILVVGNLLFTVKMNMLFAVIGTVLAVIIGYLLQILFFSVDYKRTEIVQYEDDEYYYYVKAVPKLVVVNEDLKVKRINAQKARKTDNIKKSRRKANESDNASQETGEDEITFVDNLNLNENESGKF